MILAMRFARVPIIEKMGTNEEKKKINIHLNLRNIFKVERPRFEKEATPTGKIRGKKQGTKTNKF